MNENKNDIHIGETERIHWVEFDTSRKEFFKVDDIIAKHDDFWALLQINCVPECCGLEAFGFYPEEILNASKHINKILLKEDLKKLKFDIQNSNKDIIVSSRLNNLVHKSVFIKLLDHIIKYL